MSVATVGAPGVGAAGPVETGRAEPLEGKKLAALGFSCGLVIAALGRPPTAGAAGATGAEPDWEVGLAEPDLEVGLAEPDLEVGLAEPDWEVGLAEPDWEVGLAEPTGGSAWHQNGQRWGHGGDSGDSGQWSGGSSCGRGYHWQSRGRKAAGIGRGWSRGSSGGGHQCAAGRAQGQAGA